MSMYGAAASEPKPTASAMPHSAEEVRGIYGGAPGEYELTPRNYWPTTMFSRRYKRHAEDASAIIAHLQELKAAQMKNIESDVAVVMKSEHGLYESKLDLFETTEHPQLKTLVAFIESSVKRAVWHVNGRSVDLNRIRVKFVDSWFHITNDSGFHDAHYHGGCSWCGMYYLQMTDVPEVRPSHAPNGVNRFWSPIPHGGILSDFGNHYLGNGCVDVPPIPGTLVLFPAYLLHSGLPYKGDKDRVLLAFNTTSTLEPEARDGTR